MRIRELRRRADLTQEQLAEKAKLRTATISQLERGKGNPEWSSFVAIADALGCHVLDLFEDDRSDPDVNALIEKIRSLEPETRRALASILDAQEASKEAS